MRGTAREYLRANGSKHYVAGDWDALAAVAPDGRVWLIRRNALSSHHEVYLEGRGPLTVKSRAQDLSRWLVSSTGTKPSLTCA